MKSKIHMKQAQFAIMFFCVGFLAFCIYWMPLEVFFKSLSRTELFKFMPVPIAVLMGFITITLNDWKARQRDASNQTLNREREDCKLLVEKVEMLYLESEIYTRTAIALNKALYKGGGTRLNISTQSNEVVYNNWYESLSRMQMILELYFPNEGFDEDVLTSDLLIGYDSDEYGELAKSKADIDMLARYELAENYIDETNRYLKNTCVDLMKKYTYQVHT